MGAPSKIQAALIMFMASCLWLHATAPAALSRTRFPAKGRNEAILDVVVSGRYSLVVASKQGSRIQIVDRMLGPAESDGTIGERDGRLDLLLDAGHYKVLVDSPEQGKGDAALEVHPCTELHVPEPPLLVEHKPIRENLDDFQQLSWWIHVNDRRFVYLEAQGRNLADLRLWRDGVWLLDSVPQVKEAEPVKGKPERSCLLVANLNPGFYLVTAYGGAALRWAKDSGEHALSLRFGIPELPDASRIDGRISPFGTDRYLVPKGANSYIAQLTEKKSFNLDVASFDLGDVPGTGEASASIDKKSADPECKIRHTTSKAFTLVNVSGAPGEPYVLQCFDEEDLYTFRADHPQDYRITTFHSGYVDDHIDATCLLVSQEQDTIHRTVYAEDVIHIGGEKGWARRFNLLDGNTIFFFVDETGDYQIRCSGTEAQFRFEPFMLTRPIDYQEPAFQDNGGVFSLDKGYWILTIQPRTKGILKVALQQKGFLERLKDWVLGTDLNPPAPAKGSCELPKVQLDPKWTYSLYMNHQDGVNHGVLLRALPLKFEEPIPLTLQPGKDESIAVTANGNERLKVFTLKDAKFACFVDGKPWSEEMPVGPGSHAIWIRNDGQKSLAFTLQGVPEAQAAGAPPQFLGPEEKKALDQHLPVLSESTPVFFDLGKQEQRTSLLNVASPGLYRIETTGLLKTAITIRSAVRTKLFSAEANGIGRNALLAQYLKEGQYLLTVQTMDESAGHTGLRIRRTEVTKGGELVQDREAKADVPANQGMLYTFATAKEGKYAVQTLGQNRFFPCRLEDSEGWPILAPSTPSNLVQQLVPGTYRFMSLPLDVDTQRLTSFSAIPEARHLEGKGPHALALNEKVENRWREPEQGADRARDTYRVMVPASLDVSVKFGNDQMQGFLKKIGSSDAPITVPPKKNWTGTLEAGEYLFEVECGRINDRVDYSLQITTAQLAPGLKQELAVPGSIDVRLAKESVVEIFSHGQLDVRGLLYRDGQLVDFSDDSFNDWNFRIARRLEAGDYSLKVEPVGGKPGRTMIGMFAPAEVLKQALPTETDQTLDLAGAINVFPIQIKPGTNVFSVKVSGAAQYGCILERVNTSGSVPLVTRTGRDIAIDIPLAQDGTYRLRLWSADHQSESVHLRIGGAAASAIATTQSLSGSKFARIKIDKGGTFAPEPSEGFTFSTAIEQPFELPENGLAALPSGETTIHWNAGGNGRLTHVVLDKELRLRIPKGTRQELDVKTSPVGPTVILTHGLNGQSACLALPGETRPYLSRSYALAGSDGGTVIPPAASGRVLIWNPQEEETSVSEISVSGRTFQAMQNAGTLTPGSFQGTLPAGTGRQWNLPSGTKQVDLTLGDGLFAYLSENSAVSAVAFARGEISHDSFSTTAAQLVIVSLSGQPAAYELNLMDRASASLSAPLATGQLFEQVFPEGGTLRFEVGPGEGERTFSVMGSSVSCEWMDAQGQLHAGLNHDVRNGGVATITHGPGLVKAWLSPKGKELALRWGSAQPGQDVTLKPNSIEALSGASGDYRVTVQKPTALHLRVGCPAVVRLGTDANPASKGITEGYPETRLDAFLPPGEYRLAIRALQGDSLHGAAEFTLAEVIPIEKTFGPEGLIHGGETQVYSFNAKTEGSFGIGLKMDKEALACQLLRADGTEMGTGSQQFVDLEPGTYLLRVSLPPGQEPVKYTPVVVGLEPPSSGPPAETLKEFLDGLGLLP